MRRSAIRVEALCKSYRIPHPEAPRWRDYLRRPRQAIGRRRFLEVDALRNVDFHVDDGEVLGIIGRNGAGKSTLLKILSRITMPSGGRAVIAGRVASLLEVGTGFHPELTGRENVHLNGMLLGMPSREIGRAFDAICDFACVGPYIDVPIKRYSSGMQLRLAFAVAAHLAADTMIIDEVLAVGDAEFQRKCLGAMRDVSQRGRTTLFVSHNMAAVQSLCSRVLWLDHGNVRAVGSPQQVIRDYLAAAGGGSGPAPTRIDLSGKPRPWVLGLARLSAVSFERLDAAEARAPWTVGFGEPFELELAFRLDRPIPDLVAWIAVRNERGEDVLSSHSCDEGDLGLRRDARAGTMRVRIEQPWLLPGKYHVETALQSGQQLLDCVRDSAVLTVEEHSAEGAPSLGLKKGMLAPIWQWRIVECETSPAKTVG